MPEGTSKNTLPAWQEPILDAIEAIVANRFAFCCIVLLGLVLGSIRLLLLPPTYESSAVAVLLAREKSVIDASIDTSSIETSDHTASRSLAGNLMLPPDPSLYTTIIMSEAVLSEIANRLEGLNLYKISDLERSEEVTTKLRSMIHVSSTEEGILKIKITSTNPELSAAIANALFEECVEASRKIEQNMLISQANHLDTALSLARSRLESTEKKLAQMAEAQGLIDTDLQASNNLRNTRELKAKFDAVEADLEEALLSHTEKSPTVIALRARKDALERQIEESGASVIGAVGSRDFVSFNADYKHLSQEAQLQRDMVSAIATKADIFRIRASQPIGNLAIIREAIVPTRPAGPSKKANLGLALGLSLIVAFAYCLFSQQIRQLANDPELSSRTNKLLSQIHPKLKLPQSS